MHEWCGCGVHITTAQEFHHTSYHECEHHDFESCRLCGLMTATLVSIVEGYLFPEATTRKEQD